MAEDRPDDRPDDGPGDGPDDGPDQSPDLTGALETLETSLLGGAPELTRVQVTEQAEVPLEMAQELWRLLGFAQQSDEEVAFTDADVQALRYADDLARLGILSPERQAALVRTWGRSYARLAEWQTKLLTEVALEADDPVAQIERLNAEVLPRVESLQDYVWRRHLLNAGARMLATGRAGADSAELAVVFCDIVGFTSRSKELEEGELVSWIEGFESMSTELVVDHGGRIIKNIGDEVLFVADDVQSGAATALAMVARGADPDDDFPEVRAGLAFGEVVSRLGDVFGPTVNIASRLTSLARPGAVLVDQGAHDALKQLQDPTADDAAPGYLMKRVHRASVKGYSHLSAWVLRPAD